MEQQSVFCEGDKAMVVRCEDVWHEVSNYLDDEVDSELRVAIEEHVRGCRRCTAVVDGARNIVQIYGDERMVEVPLGFSRRLHQRLEGSFPSSRRTFFGWLVAAAAAILVAGGFEVARSSTLRQSPLRSQHAQTSARVPAEMMVVVAEEGKTFHVNGCTFIHDKANLRSIPAWEAEQEGYTPCVRCMKKYLDSTAVARSKEGIRSTDVRT
jgi:Putative zinc-finger